MDGRRRRGRASAASDGLERRPHAGRAPGKAGSGGPATQASEAEEPEPHAEHLGAQDKEEAVVLVLGVSACEKQSFSPRLREWPAEMFRHSVRFGCPAEHFTASLPEPLG